MTLDTPLREAYANVFKRDNEVDEEEEQHQDQQELRQQREKDETRYVNECSR